MKLNNYKAKTKPISPLSLVLSCTTLYSLLGRRGFFSTTELSLLFLRLGFLSFITFSRLFFFSLFAFGNAVE